MELLLFLVIIYLIMANKILASMPPNLPPIVSLMIVYGSPIVLCILSNWWYRKKNKQKRIAQQEAALRREQTLKELEARFDTNSYTQAEMEHLIYTADLTTGQKDTLRRKYALPKSRQQPSD